MKTLKVLNLYAGIGGNRKLWGDNIEVTAVEFDSSIANIYKELYPNDTVIIGDAHEYLLNNYKNFDAVWASPPCQSHSSFRQNIGVRFRGVKPVYPDMKLYQEIIFLQYNFKGKYVVENVNPYYQALIPATSNLQRHLFWSNFDITNKEFEKDNIRSSNIGDLEKLHGFDLSKYKLANKRQVLRNCVSPLVGLHIMENLVASL